MLLAMNPWPIVRQLFVEAGRIARQHRRALVRALLGVALGVVVLLAFDHPWNDWLLRDQPEAWVTLADRFSYWGDFHTGTFIICGAIWLAGWWRQLPRWRVAALAAVLAAACAGLEVVALRFVLGRPRPSEQVADGLRGLRLHSGYASFPSGHSATSFGTAGALVALVPPVGIPVMIGASGVVWSRLYKSAHYPSDVWAGACIGLLHGLIFAAAARRLLRPVVNP